MSSFSRSIISEDDLCRAMQLTVPVKGNKVTMAEVRENAMARRVMLDKAVGAKARERVARLLWKDGRPYHRGAR